jgi:DNA-binding protein H-NS
MEIQNIQRKERKSVAMSIRTYKKYSKFMKENNISPTALFNESVKSLMEEQKVVS